MKLLINTSTLSGTGVTQVAVSFITECIKFSNHQYEVFLSKSVSDNLVKEDFPDNFNFYQFDESPLKSIKTNYHCKKLYKQIKPDCVFSVFGPSYWTPSVPHLQGYAYPHYVYPESPIFHNMSIREKITNLIYKSLHKFFLKRNGKYYVTETEDVSNRLHEIFDIPISNIYTVHNTYNKEVFKIKEANAYKNNQEFKLLSLCSPYKHKNLAIINRIIEEIENRNLNINIKFIVTINSEAFDSLFSDKAKKYIYNEGPIKIKDCPRLYQQCDAIFLPTLLECFSANYPEAMVMRKPILTSDLPFAKCVCKDAAIYFNPLDPKDILDKIIELYHSPNLYSKLTENGLNVLASLPTSEDRAFQYLTICENLCKKK